MFSQGSDDDCDHHHDDDDHDDDVDDDDHAGDDDDDDDFLGFWVSQGKVDLPKLHLTPHFSMHCFFFARKKDLP